MPNQIQVRGHVLVVDDYQPIREIVRAILEGKHGFSVSEARNGQDAVLKAKELRPDLILLDLAMPDFNGAEVATVLHQYLPDTPIVVLTMYEGATEQLLGRTLSERGISAVISKSTGLVNLAECVAKLVPAPPQRMDTVVGRDRER